MLLTLVSYPVVLWTESHRRTVAPSRPFVCGLFCHISLLLLLLPLPLLVH